MELITLENNKPVVELRKIAEVFNKNHYNLLKQCKQLIEQAVELEDDILKTAYTDSQGRSKPTYHLTQKGFSILCMGFNGKKALEWKIKFYNAFEQMKAENTLLRGILTDILRPELNGGKSSAITKNNDIMSNCNDVKSYAITESNNTMSNCNKRPKILTANSIVNIVEQMKAENTLHTQYLQLLNNKWDNTVCITDICCKFKDLEPARANQLLQNAGMIEHRASGWYPSLNYNGSDMLVSATAVNPYTNKLDNYVRYTPKGYEHVYNYLLKQGEEANHGQENILF